MDETQQLQDQEYCFPYHYVTRFRGNFSQSFTDSWGANYATTIEYVLSQLDGLDFNSIVDIGCGDGRLTREMAIRYPDRLVLGIDYSPRAIRLAEAMNQDVESANFMCCDIAQDKIEKRFDVAVLMEVFEHVPCERAASFLDGVRMLLRPGADLLLTVPHVNKPVEPKHFRHFNVATLREQLEDHFDILSVVPFERISIMRTILAKTLHNGLFSLTSRRALNWIYSYQKDHLFRCSDESECQRIFVHARAR
ncbi:hypothetical protein N800_03670 [Lysobacter daejeonensis GH1-9]|uniref:Methyltransferase domain-containing protein n=1 Tax=Lysobacter daejeonensis GH1-9 TaxID=1385517 RepID=A0A0A0ESH4_9GAMM|nr:class I SAM-dependent methyltransferase [Lysobacter daejeonensis]KGM53861.1 hypothetical protein N800_03670 [Lysobacter daejeonensis GH1-9]